MDADEIAHNRELIKTYKETLRVLELQAASHGTVCPPHIQTEMNNIRKKINDLELEKKKTTVKRSRSVNPAIKKKGAATTNRTTDLDKSDITVGRVKCPYPGMVPFRAEDARFFYGREMAIQHMLKHLRNQRLLFVIGPSGSGKSSLVYAGFLPRLSESAYFTPGFWVVREIHPGDQPMQTLAKAIEGGLDQFEQSLVDLLRQHPPSQRLLLVIDQFEELFTQAEQVEQSQFIATLQVLRSIKQCALLIVMRADFYPDLMESDFWPVNPGQRLEIAPLRGEALRRAIQQPAADVGVQLEPGLLERLVADASDEPGALPLVQETMVLLWDKMEHRLLPLHAYAALDSEGRSGLAVAISDKADAALEGLSNAEQEVARRIFLRLIHFGEGRPDTRRQQSLAALRTAGDDVTLFHKTIKHLTDNCLLTLSGDEHDVNKKVDIAHEILITAWPTLGQWLLERREAEQTRRRLDAKVDEWIQLRQGNGGLLDVEELHEAERWLASSDAADLGFSVMLPELVRISRTATEEAERAQHARVALEIMHKLSQQINQALLENDISSLLQLAANMAARAAGSGASAMIQLYDEQHDILLSHSWSGVSRDALLAHAAVTADHHFHVIASAEALVRSGSYNPGEGQPSACVSLRVGGEILGIICVVYNRDHWFTPNEIKILDLCASQAAISISIARAHQQLYKRVDRLADEIGRVYHTWIGQSLTSASDTLSNLLSLDIFGPLTPLQAARLRMVEQELITLKRQLKRLLMIRMIEDEYFSLTKTQVDLRAFIQEVCIRVHEKLDERQIELICNVDGLTTLVDLDEERITQVLTDILMNAVKFTPLAGRIEIWGREADREIEIGISDNGRGIAPEHLDFIFEKYYQAPPLLNNEQASTGLGLYLARQVVKLHGGDLRVESQLGQGSTFIISLPKLTASHDGDAYV